LSQACSGEEGVRKGSVDGAYHWFVTVDKRDADAYEGEHVPVPSSGSMHHVGWEVGMIRYSLWSSFSSPTKE